MAKFFSFFLIAIFQLGFGSAQTVPFRIFDNQGKPAEFDDILKESQKAEVVFFGELHNNSIVHWLQLQLLQEMSETGRELILAGEFFERDDQINVDEWFADLITEKNFEAEAKLWGNYKTDYKPLMAFAKENNIPFIASNIPRKYASMVSRKGLAVLDSLSQEAKKHIAPLPITIDKSLPGYRAMKEMVHGSGMDPEFLIEAQAIKDATMAYSLFDHIGNGKTILHINGNYHSKNEEGIIWYLNMRFPNTNILTISSVEQDAVDSLNKDFIGSADFIIALPKDSPKSY